MENALPTFLTEEISQLSYQQYKFLADYIAKKQTYYENIYFRKSITNLN